MEINYTTGFAGTGKSTALLNLLKTVNPLTTVVLCPTHKAIKRLSTNLPRQDIEIKTIHALLGWVPGINENAEQLSHIDVTIKLDKPIEDYKHIIIDEGGMMSEDMLMEITSKLEEKHDFDTDGIVIDIFLDPYQLLPVKGKQIELDPDTTTNLTQQYRAESPDIVSTFTKFVNFLQGTNKKDLVIKPSENIIFIDKLQEFNPKTDRLLAYTNECVGNYNQEIARLLKIKNYTNQWVQLGNYPNLIKVDKIISPNLNLLISHFNSGTLFLQNNKINKKYLEQSLQALIDCNYIDFIETNDIIIPVIIGIENAYRIRKEARLAALENKHNFKWLYAMDRAFTMDYSFASTVHKAQGSEFERVFIVKSDIQKAIINNYYETYARLMYVALSRARKTIFILP